MHSFIDISESIGLCFIKSIFYKSNLENPTAIKIFSNGPHICALDARKYAALLVKFWRQKDFPSYSYKKWTLCTRRFTTLLFPTITTKGKPQTWVRLISGKIHKSTFSLHFLGVFFNRWTAVNCQLSIFVKIREKVEDVIDNLIHNIIIDLVELFWS